MTSAAEPDPPDPQGLDGEWLGDVFLPPVPDAVDLVLEAATMESVFAAQRLMRIDAMRREMLAEDAGRGAGVTDLVERSIRLELASAMRVTEYAAGQMIVQAEALVHRYPAALAALAAGRITTKHAAILVEKVDQVQPELREEVAARAVELAEAEPVGTFQRALRALIQTLEAPTLEQRYQTALQARRVVVERGTDGMGALITYAPEVEVHAIFARATAIAKTIAAQDGETRTLDQIRADVVCDLLIDGVTGAMPTEARGIRASVVVTVPVLALLDDELAKTADPPVVESIGPIPLSRARELCGGDASWMRVLTHPETGMVLSVGRKQYPPPPPLRKLTKWRADRCMGPGCWMPASRCEVDHQIRWVDGGETSLENLAPFCKNHHLIKDNTDWVVAQVPGSGGAVEWISPTGRRHVVQPERRVPVFTVAAEHDPAPAPF
ncbi:HNH endonuclease [Microbacterium sp. HD4P20]|uniref:HNH endonuclease signature motif containing protein n=1 Tax=Microbacterium sp. HD4P20 TaxID=2864874 RepID=UPI001C6426DD|nr:HNH endonuclease signature motif containing protein [Microbacterium sp. HD4P20]MCP2638125.1 HNH endonuclease [Microbacterium sp. HD4P20]